jgi:hypothetical protein
MTRFSDWSGYVAKTTGNRPRPLYQRAVALFDHPGTAVERRRQRDPSGPKHWHLYEVVAAKA